MAEKIDREEWIKQFMAATGQPRERAEFAAALEFDELAGDTEIVDTLEDNNDD